MVVLVFFLTDCILPKRRDLIPLPTFFRHQDVIPENIAEQIFPQIADGTIDAAVLRHECGINVQFFVGDSQVITKTHLKSWQAKTKDLADLAGENCFSYNDLKKHDSGVYLDRDQNMYSILLSPSTFLEHNEVEGQPILLVIDERSCILTGADSTAGRELIEKHLKTAIATKVVGIDKTWSNWTAI